MHIIGRKWLFYQDRAINGTKSLTRADLSEIRKAISEIETEISNVENGGKRRIFRGLPRDL